MSTARAIPAFFNSDGFCAHTMGAIYTFPLQTPLGDALAAARDGALYGLWFKNQKHYPHEMSSWTAKPEEALFTLLHTWLDHYFAGKKTSPDFALCPQGTPFQLEVWNILLRIPYGTLTTYAGIAEQLAQARGGKAASARAVGGAVGRNPISVLIPCHRVVGSTGSLVGYAGGLDKKKALLKLEGAL